MLSKPFLLKRLDENVMYIIKYLVIIIEKKTEGGETREESELGRVPCKQFPAVLLKLGIPKSG